jgi:hypothetical protein
MTDQPTPTAAGDERMRAFIKECVADGSMVVDDGLTSRTSLIRQIADLRAELDRVSAAIGTDQFMDPPDGGSVSLSEQVRRMRVALEKAEADRDEARERQCNQLREVVAQRDRANQLKEAALKEASLQCGYKHTAIARAEKAEGRAEELEGLLRDMTEFLTEWHDDFPEHIGDKERHRLVAARAALGKGEAPNVKSTERANSELDGGRDTRIGGEVKP